MDAVSIGSLVNLGAAGAVIIVVWLFLKENSKRDDEWRDFFTQLNSGNKSDICELTSLMTKLTQAVDDISRNMYGLSSDLKQHDSRVDARVMAVHEIATKPLKKTANKTNPKPKDVPKKESFDG